MLKRVTSLFVSTSLLLVILVAVTTREAHAYIDLASGSYMIQMLVVLAFSSLFAVKVFWQRIISRVSRFFSRIRGSEPGVK